MITKIAGYDMDLSKVTHVSNGRMDTYYKVHFEGGEVTDIFNSKYPREKFVKLWKNSKVEGKPILWINIPAKHIRGAENPNMAMKSMVDWVSGQVGDKYHVVVFADNVEKVESTLLSVSDVDDSDISDLQNEVIKRLEELKKEE